MHILVTILIVINGEIIRSNDKILSISDGLSFGFCRDYCRRSINISSIENELIGLKEANFEQDEYPPVEKRYPFPSNDWQELINLVDPESFRSLDERIGCPDCADGGAEWIEIQWTNENKRVTFENGQLIKGFEGLVVKLRELEKNILMIFKNTKNKKNQIC